MTSLWLNYSENIASKRKWWYNDIKMVKSFLSLRWKYAMKVAIVGSRRLYVSNIGDYLSAEITEIVSGGAKGVDSSAREYALKNNIRLTEFLPEYNKYGKAAPLKRDMQIINYADKVIAFWDGKSKGTKYVIENCKKTNTPVDIIYIDTRRDCD